MSDAVARAEMLLSAGRLDDAVALLTEHLSTQPQDGRALLTLAQVSAMRGDYVEAERAARAALADPRVDGLPQAALSRVLAFDQSRADEATHWAEQAVARRPQSSEFRSILAARRAEAGRLHEAVSLAEESLALAPDEPLARSRAHMLVARAFIGVAEGAAIARDHAYRALELNPADETARKMAATAEQILAPTAPRRRSRWVVPAIVVAVIGLGIVMTVVLLSR